MAYFLTLKHYNTERSGTNTDSALLL